MKLVVFQASLRKGGTERQAIAIANAAQQRGHKVTLLTSRPGGHFLNELKVPRISLQPLDTGLEEWMPGFDAALKKLSPDLVLCMGQAANAAIPRLKKICPKVVASIRTGKRISKKRLFSYAKADLIITNSYAWESALNGLGLKKRVEVVGNSLLMATSRDEAARILLRKKFGAGPETVVVLCFQRFLLGKRQHILIENFVNATHDLDAQLWLLDGSPLGWFLNGFYGWFLKSYARVLGEGKIKVVARHFPEAYYYSAADAAATMSHEDSLPNFLIEAHAFGLPGICEDYAGCGEVVVGGITGFVVPVDDDAAYVTALRQMALSPVLRKFLGENAKNLSFRFNYEKQMGRLLDLLEGLCRE